MLEAIKEQGAIFANEGDSRVKILIIAKADPTHNSSSNSTGLNRLLVKDLKLVMDQLHFQSLQFANSYERKQSSKFDKHSNIVLTPISRLSQSFSQLC